MLPGSDGVPHISSKMILGVLSLAALAYAVLSSAVIPALPTFQRSLGASETGVTWLLTGFLLSASVGDRAGLLRAGQPHRAGRPGQSDGRGQRDEHGAAHARRGGRRADRGQIGDELEGLI